MLSLLGHPGVPLGLFLIAVLSFAVPGLFTSLRVPLCFLDFVVGLQWATVATKASFTVIPEKSILSEGLGRRDFLGV